MSRFGFVMVTAKQIDDGAVASSKYATAGPNRVAVEGSQPPFIVYNDAEKIITLHGSALGAAHEWDKVNRRLMRSEFHAAP